MTLHNQFVMESRAVLRSADNLTDPLKRTCKSLEMASFASEKIHLDITKRSLKYNKSIKKIPEYWKVDEQDYPLLPCSDIYSLMVVYDKSV